MAIQMSFFADPSADRDRVCAHAPSTQPTQPPTSWKALIDAFTEAHPAYAEATKQAIEQDLNKLGEMYPRIKPLDLTAAAAEKAVARVKAEESDATARRRHSTWRSVYGWVEEQTWGYPTPFRLSYTEATPEPFYPIDFLSRTEAEHLTRVVAQDPEVHFVIRLALDTGMKSSEIRDARIGDFDDGADTVWIQPDRWKRPENGGVNAAERARPRRQQRRRCVQVQHDLFDLLDEYLRFTGRSRADMEPRDHIFQREVRTLQRLVRRGAKASKMDVTLSTLRWTRAVWDLQNRVDSDRVRMKLGYSRQGWAKHGYPRLRRFVPDAREGRMPAA